ncbi:MAG: M23 family metallopeptidase [Anaerolineae bacterium]|nr:MAG: M23 family metallopeptidase [Anaerolineae bacterium]
MKKAWHIFWPLAAMLVTGAGVYFIFSFSALPLSKTVKVDLLATAQYIHPIQPFAALNPTFVKILIENDPYTDKNSLWNGATGVPPVGMYLPGLKGLPTRQPTATTVGYTPPPATPTPLPTDTPLPLPTSPPIVIEQPEVALAQPEPTEVPAVITTFGGEGCAPAGFPVEGILTQYYNVYHAAIDLALPAGNPVVATHSGTVIFAGWDNTGYGNMVKIQNGSFITAYAHLSGINVNNSDQVGKGSVIGFVGSTGNSSGSHLHYEIYIDSIPVDPLTFDQRGFSSC